MHLPFFFPVCPSLLSNRSWPIWLYHDGTAWADFKGRDDLSKLIQHTYSIADDRPLISSAYSGFLRYDFAEYDHTWPTWIFGDGNAL